MVMKEHRQHRQHRLHLFYNRSLGRTDFKSAWINIEQFRTLRFKNVEMFGFWLTKGQKIDKLTM